MASFSPKGNFSKKDMNFFAEFTEKAARMARYLAYAVIGIVAVIGVMLVMILIAVGQNLALKGKINDLEKTLASEEYATIEAEYNQLQAEITEKTQYLYALGEMRNQVDTTAAASTELAAIIKDNIPNEAYVDMYSVTGTLVTIQGYTFDYFTASEYINLLQQSNVFASVSQMDTERVPITNAFDQDKRLLNTINTYYQFAIAGSLTSDYTITVKRFVENGNTLNAIGQTEIYLSADGNYAIPGDGSVFSFDTITTAQQGAETYSLSYVIINNTRMSQEEFATVIANDNLQGTVNTDTTIELYYSVGGAS